MVKKIKKLCLIASIIFVTIFVVQLIQHGISSVEDFQEFVKGYGAAGPLVLIFIQALQVVIPIIPGQLGYGFGTISYGVLPGFICNYVGICAGSIIAYFLAEKYGTQIVIDLFSEKEFNKWKSKIENKKSYDWFLFVATLLPLFPDDLLCYLSGLIGMKRSRFIWIIILGKPWCILAYCIGFGFI